MNDSVFELIIENPGIDTPMVCIMLHKESIEDPNLKGFHLASWLMKNHREKFNQTCAIIDLLLDRGEISFSDSGELHAIGY